MAKAKKDKHKEPVEAELDKEDGTAEKPRRVFQCLDPTHPSQLVSLSTHGYSEGGVSYPARSRSISANIAAQFILPEDSPDYDVQYEALKRACKRGRWPMVEVGGGKELVKPEFLRNKSTSDKDKLIAKQTELDAKCDILVRNASTMAKTDAVLVEKDEKIMQLEARLIALEARVSAGAAAKKQ